MTVTNIETNIQRIVRLILLAFLLICSFDPANLITGAKVYVFIALWLATAASAAARKRMVSAPPLFLIYVLIFVTLPALSILWYLLIDGRSPFEGFQLLKAYLLISLALVLYANRMDLMPQSAAVLTGLACATIALFVFLQVQPGQIQYIDSLGRRTGVLLLERRDYGHGLKLFQVHFFASAMLSFSIAYYFHRMMVAQERRSRLTFGGITAVNVLGMILAGSRSNIFMAVLLPCLLWPLYTRHALRNGLIVLGVLVLCAIPLYPQFKILLDPQETANAIKLALLSDYARILSNPTTLLFGQGLGAYEYWSARGYSYFVSELTYLEMIRNFGVFGATVMAALLLWPIWSSVGQSATRQRALAIAFFLYLGMSISNPLLFSSEGMLALSILLANLAMRLPPSRAKAQMPG